MRLVRGAVCVHSLSIKTITDYNLGIYGPGYEERRRQRIKENYGIDVPEPYYKKQ